MKPFEFPLHNAADWFSRNVLWLDVMKSNNSPVVPADLYPWALKEHGVGHIILKTDGGSEKADMHRLQCYESRNIDPYR